MNLKNFQEFPNELDVDPLSLPEIHEHMIRSPPPTNWPKSPYFKVFTFPNVIQTETGQVLLYSFICSHFNLTYIYIYTRRYGFIYF